MSGTSGNSSKVNNNDGPLPQGVVGPLQSYLKNKGLDREQATLAMASKRFRDSRLMLAETAANTLKNAFGPGVVLDDYKKKVRGALDRKGKMLPSQAVKALTVHPGRSRVAKRLADLGEISAKAERIIRGDDQKATKYVKKLLARMLGIDRTRDNKVLYEHTFLITVMVLNKIINSWRDDFHIVRPADFQDIATYIGISDCYHKFADFFESFDMDTYYSDLTQDDLRALRATAERAASQRSQLLANLVSDVAQTTIKYPTKVLFYLSGVMATLGDLFAKYFSPDKYIGITTSGVMYFITIMAILKVATHGIGKGVELTVNTLTKRFRDQLCKYLVEASQPAMQEIDGILDTSTSRIRHDVDRSLDLKREYIKAGSAYRS
jgi:hypothetical protein